jgi:hypothetical protein
MYGNNSALSQPRRTGKSAIRKVGILIRELSDDDDDDDDANDDDSVEPGASSATSDSMAPWRKDFKGYLYSKDQLGDMTIVEWWGVCISRALLYDCAEYGAVELYSIRCLGISRTRYTPDHGIISFQRTRVLVCGNHHQQAP